MKKQSVLSKRRFLIILGLVLVMLAASATWVFAKEIMSDGAIYACALKDGTLRIVQDANQCKEGETLQTWNIMGAKGNPGWTCWDLNGNGAADPEEDLNLDEAVDFLDCWCTG